MKQKVSKERYHSALHLSALLREAKALDHAERNNLERVAARALLSIIEDETPEAAPVEADGQRTRVLIVSVAGIGWSSEVASSLIEDIRIGLSTAFTWILLAVAVACIIIFLRRLFKSL